MSIQVLNTIKAIEKDIAAMTAVSIASIRARIDHFGETVCSSNAEILRRQLWAQARSLELI